MADSAACIACEKDIGTCECLFRKRSEEDIDLQARLILTYLSMISEVDKRIEFMKDRLREAMIR